MRKILSLVMVGILFISFNSELNAQWGKKNKTPVEYPENFDKELFELRYEEVVELEQNINKEETFDESITDISATKIRKDMRNKGEL
ncbi:MAG: hypothetical protein ABGW72_00035 [bacterium]|jgi:hypothetical protein|nr:hypothetical protein [Candidatus Neomarinimicrobiota bacterium]